MFKINAGTTILIYAPFGKIANPNDESALTSKDSLLHDSFPWKGYVTKEDRLYEKEQVWDIVALENNRELPFWAMHNIRLGYTIVQRDGKFAMVRRNSIHYID